MGLFSRAIALDPEEHSTEEQVRQQSPVESRQTGLLKRARQAQGAGDTTPEVKKKARLRRTTSRRRNLRRT